MKLHEKQGSISASYKHPDIIKSAGYMKNPYLMTIF